MTYRKMGCVKIKNHWAFGSNILDETEEEGDLLYWVVNNVFRHQYSTFEIDSSHAFVYGESNKFSDDVDNMCPIYEISKTKSGRYTLKKTKDTFEDYLIKTGRRVI